MIYTVIYSDGKKQIFNNFQRYGNRPIAKGENLAIVSVQGEVEVFIFKKDGLDELARYYKSEHGFDLTCNVKLSNCTTVGDDSKCLILTELVREAHE